MDFELSPTARDLQVRLLDFMHSHVLPAEQVYRDQMAEAGDPHAHPPVIEVLKAEARSRGLWNLFLPHKTEWTDGLSNSDYAPLAEIMGRSPLASEATNCCRPRHRQHGDPRHVRHGRAEGAVAAAPARPARSARASR